MPDGLMMAEALGVTVRNEELCGAVAAATACLTPGPQAAVLAAARATRSCIKSGCQVCLHICAMQAGMRARVRVCVRACVCMCEDERVSTHTGACLAARQYGPWSYQLLILPEGFNLERKKRIKEEEGEVCSLNAPHTLVCKHLHLHTIFRLHALCPGGSPGAFAVST